MSAIKFSAEDSVLLIRTGWIVLCSMMFFSRIIFQAAGADQMKMFLDTGRRSRTKRIWALVALAYALLALILVIPNFFQLIFVEAGLFVVLSGALIANGLLNFLPARFRDSSEKLREAWVRTLRSGRGRSDYKALFGTLNTFLAIASAGMAAIVVFYKPIEVRPVFISLGIAMLLTIVLVAGTMLEDRSFRQFRAERRRARSSIPDGRRY